MSTNNVLLASVLSLLAATGAGAQTSVQAPTPTQSSAKTTTSSAALADARRHYNNGRYDDALKAADVARADWQTRHPGNLVYGRAAIERFRQTASVDDLSHARDALRSVDASRLEVRDRLDLVVGLGETLYFDGQYRVAAEVFTSVLDQAHQLGPSAHDQLLDWWATSLDRFAQSRPIEERAAVYDRIVAQMDGVMRRDPGSATASYWAAAGWRGKGDLERAWDAALAGWVLAQLARDRGASLRPDIDVLVRDAIIPDRVRRMTPVPPDVEQATAAMIAEWDAFKERWAPSMPLF